MHASEFLPGLRQSAMSVRRTANACISAAMLAVFAVACGQTSDPVALIAKAQAYRKNGDYPAAIIELRNALQLNPENGEARYLLGTAYLESGDAAFATVELKKALDSGYDGRRVLPDLAKSLIAQEKFKEAIDETDPATVPNAQGSPEILNVRAYAQMLMRQPAAAKASLDLAMVLRPDFADGMVSQARLAVLEGDAARAAALIDSAVAASPENVDALLFRGGLLRQRGQIAQARDSYRKAIQVNPRSTAARLDLASLEIDAKHYEDAATELEAVRQIAPRNVMGVYFKALLELRTGNNQAALESISKALEIAPKHVPSTLLGGVAELALGNPERAQKYLNAALEIDSRNLYARKMLAATQLQRGQLTQAIATLEPVIEGGQGASDPALLALAGEAYMQNRQYTKATQYFERAASLDPKNASTRIGLGMSRLATGSTDRAVADLEAAAALGTGGARADVMLAMLNIKRKEYDQALKTIAKLEKSTPSNPVVYNLKAAAYVGKGDAVQARAQFEKALQADPTFFPAAANLALLDLQAGDVAAARRRYEAVLQKDKKQVQAMLGLADLASRERGKDAEAQEWIKKAKAANAEARAPVQAEIDLYRRSNQLDKALAVAMEQKKLRPSDPEALEMVGKLLVAMGHAKDAVSVYGDRTVLLPNSAPAFVDLASVQMMAGNPGGAADSLQRALRIDSKYPEARAMLVAAELAQDRSVRALTVAREVQNDMPKAPLGYVLEGDVLMATKKSTQATALYEKAYRLRKSGFVAAKVYDAWVEAGKPDVGEARLKDWLAEHPEDTTARRHLAYGRMERGKYAQAIEQYKIVLERQPNDRVALNNVAWAMSKLKDPEAARFAQQAYELKPDDGAVADTYATILIDHGDLPRGLAILQKAVADAPGNREIRYHLAQALAKSGDKPKAIGQLEIVVGSGTRFAQETEALALLKQLRQ